MGRGPLQNVRIMNGLDPDFGSKCPDYERRSGQKSPKMSGFLNGNLGGFSGVLLLAPRPRPCLHARVLPQIRPKCATVRIGSNKCHFSGCLLPITANLVSQQYHLPPSTVPATVPVPPIHLPSRRFLARHPTCPSSSPSNSFTSPDILHPTPPAHTRSADPPLVNQTRKILVPSCTQM